MTEQAYLVGFINKKKLTVETAGIFSEETPSMNFTTAREYALVTIAVGWGGSYEEGKQELLGMLVNDLAWLNAIVVRR